MKRVLLAAVAVTAMIAATPALANNRGGSGLDVDVDYENEITTKIKTDVSYEKDVELRGRVRLEGTINVSSSAVAVNDVKQISGLNTANYREENELNGENGYVDPVFGGGYSEGGLDPNDYFEGTAIPVQDGVWEGQIRAGFFAPIINTVEEFSVEGNGNVGVNLAAGYFNMQINSAALASSQAQGDATSGWAEASATSLQALGAVGQYGTPDVSQDEDEFSEGGGGNNFRDRNTILGGSISGNGNIGVNAAAGSFNQQANLLTLAVATDSVLAEANSGLVQLSLFNYVEQQDSINTVGGVTLSGANGNIGVNFAAGVGNQQLNSLTIAASQAGPQVTTPPTQPFPGGVRDPS